MSFVNRGMDMVDNFEILSYLSLKYILKGGFMKNLKVRGAPIYLFIIVSWLVFSLVYFITNDEVRNKDKELSINVETVTVVGKVKVKDEVFSISDPELTKDVEVGSWKLDKHTVIELDNEIVSIEEIQGRMFRAVVFVRTKVNWTPEGERQEEVDVPTVLLYSPRKNKYRSPMFFAPFIF